VPDLMLTMLKAKSASLLPQKIPDLFSREAIVALGGKPEEPIDVGCGRVVRAPLPSLELGAIVRQAHVKIQVGCMLVSTPHASLAMGLSRAQGDSHTSRTEVAEIIRIRLAGSGTDHFLHHPNLVVVDLAVLVGSPNLRDGSICGVACLGRNHSGQSFHHCFAFEKTGLRTTFHFQARAGNLHVHNPVHSTVGNGSHGEKC